MTKKDELFNDFDAELDAKAYAQLERTWPTLVTVLVEMVKAKITQDEIISHMARKYSHMWVDAQTIRAAVRHLENN